MDSLDITNRRPDMLHQTLAEQMGITSREIEFRKRTLGFESKHAAALEECSEYIEMRTQELVDRFYDHQTQFNEIELLIGDADTLRRLHSSMKTYVRSLFCGEYDLDYVTSRLRIGVVHKRIGVSPKLYLCGIMELKSLLATAVSEFHDLNETPEGAAMAVDALERLIMLDVGLVFGTYIRSMTAEIEAGRDRMERHAAQLEDIIEERTRELERLARHDQMTDLLNQRAFREELRREANAARRYGTTVSLAYMDLDGFKQLNDSEGHQAGDSVLQKIGSAITENLRDTDFGARYGGDEFCIIMPNTSARDGVVLCERINRSFGSKLDGVPVTLSVGIAQSGPDEYLDDTDFIRLADQKMYESKEKPGFYISVAEPGSTPDKSRKTKAAAQIERPSDDDAAET